MSNRCLRIGDAFPHVADVLPVQRPQALDGLFYGGVMHDSNENGRRSRWACPFFNKCNGELSNRDNQAGSDTFAKSPQEVRDDYCGAVNSGTNASGWASVQSSYGDAYLCPCGFVAAATRFGFPAGMSSALIAARVQVSLYVGSRTAKTWRGALPHFDLATEGAEFAKTRQSWLVATRLDRNRVGTERGWIYREIRWQEGGRRSTPERVTNLWEWRSRQIASYGAALVAVSGLGSPEFQDRGRCTSSSWGRVRQPSHGGVDAESVVGDICEWRPEFNEERQ